MNSTSAKIYVGNLSWNTNDDLLREAFGHYGAVLDCIVMRDRETGRSRGFGFVTYSSENEAQNAINTANDQELDGRRIKVNPANARGTGGGGMNVSGGYATQQGPYGGGQMGGGFPGTGFPGGYGGGAPYGGGFPVPGYQPNGPGGFTGFTPQGPYGGQGQFSQSGHYPGSY